MVQVCWLTYIEISVFINPHDDFDQTRFTDTGTWEFQMETYRIVGRGKMIFKNFKIQAFRAESGIK